MLARRHARNQGHLWIIYISAWAGDISASGKLVLIRHLAAASVPSIGRKSNAYRKSWFSDPSVQTSNATTKLRRQEANVRTKVSNVQAKMSEVLNNECACAKNQKSQRQRAGGKMVIVVPWRQAYPCTKKHERHHRTGLPIRIEWSHTS